MSPPHLVIAGMPLGNFDDVTVRFLNFGQSADLIVCESRRVAQTVLKKHKIERPDQDFLILNEHTTEEQLESLIHQCRQKAEILLVSDAGMPVFCDPGVNLIEIAEAESWQISILAGASALTLAVVRAGINRPFYFAGFAPRETKDRKNFLQDLSRRQETVVLYETGYRTVKLLEELGQLFAKDQKVFVGIDLSSDNEKVFRFQLSELAKFKSKISKKGAPVIIIEK